MNILINNRFPEFRLDYFAEKKAAGKSENGRDSDGSRRGVKRFGGELVHVSNILVRQVGTKYHPGLNVAMAKDFTIYSLIEGEVRFRVGRGKSRSKKSKSRTFIDVLPIVN